MPENIKNSAAQKTIQDPPEYNAENTENPKESSDWLGGPQNGDEIPGDDANASDGGGSNLEVNGRGRVPGAKIQDPPEYSAEDAVNPKESSDWLGGPQNGNETSGDCARNPQTDGIQKTTEAAASGSDSNALDRLPPWTTIQDPPESSAGRMGTGNIAALATEGAYQQNGQSWLGGPQNGNETPSKPNNKSDASDIIGQNLLAALQNAKLQSDLIGDLVNLTQSWVNGAIDDAQYADQLRLYGMAIG